MKLKRISAGFYHAPEANKWITVCLDEGKPLWHIYEDELCRSEYWMEFPTLKAAKTALQEEKKFLDKKLENFMKKLEKPEIKAVFTRLKDR